MKRQNLGGLARAAAIISMVTVMVAGVTFAALRSQNNVITGSRLTSASANLQIAKQLNGTYSTSMAGYNFFDLAPGGAAGPSVGNDLFLKNYGSSNLDITVSLNPTRLINSSGINLQRAHLVIFDSDGVTQLSKHSLADLQSAYSSGTPLPVNKVLGVASSGSNTANFKLRMQLDNDSTNAQQQNELENIDFIFSGTAV